MDTSTTFDIQLYTLHINCGHRKWWFFESFILWHDTQRLKTKPKPPTQSDQPSKQSNKPTKSEQKQIKKDQKKENIVPDAKRRASKNYIDSFLPEKDQIWMIFVYFLKWRRAGPQKLEKSKFRKSKF